ncbi:MAG: hypothetical protein KKD44_24815 [Proteobacteria bacterium]|nr:hypothetical protein [Pseudomonadota bacterium]
MKKTTMKTRCITLLGAFIAVTCVAQVSFADSFVNDDVIDALKDFKFGKVMTTVEKPVDKAAPSANDVMANGDSFVNASVVEALADFKFGLSNDAAPKVVKAVESEYTFMNGGDSFVNADVAKKLENFSFGKKRNVVDAN